jgi:hypothetical protein
MAYPLHSLNDIPTTPTTANTNTNTTHPTRLTSARLMTCLFEASRVTHPPHGERSFHVFYGLVCGMDDWTVRFRGELDVSMLTL